MPDTPERDELRKSFTVKEARTFRAGMTDAQVKLFAADLNAKLNPDVISGLDRLRRQVTVFLDRFAETMQPVVEATQRIAETIRPALDVIARQLPGLLERAYLPNWIGIVFPNDLDIFERILINEGIALAWVPSRDTLQLLLDAASRQERRRIIGRRWRSIARSCANELEKGESPRLVEYRKFALDAFRALESGHSSASQALSASLMDTMLRAEYGKAEPAPLTGFKRQRLDIDEFPFREAVVLGGIFGAHEPFDGDTGEPPPRNFSRHASAHAVSGRQYSRVNAVLALMHATALFRLLVDRDFRP